MTMMRKMVGLVALLLTTSARAEIPVVLTDTIKQGSGIINLMKDVTAAELQQVLSGGTLLLGVDANESAVAPESSTSVGVAIKEMELVLKTTAGDFSFSSFYTNTTAMIREAGTTDPASFHTLFGGAGSNSLTGGTTDFDPAGLDDVVEIRDIAFAGDILSAQVRVKFLDTQQNAGENEAFFDYSGGFEQFAILTAASASIIEATAAGLVEAPTSITYEVGTPTGGDLAAPSGAPEPHWLLLAAVPALLLSRKPRR